MHSTRRSTRRLQSTDSSTQLFTQLSETPTKRKPRTKIVSTSSSSEENDVEEHSTPPKQKRNNETKVVLSPGSGAANLIMKLKLEQSPKSVKPKNKFQKARQILNTNETQNLPCREKEYEELTNFLTEHLTNRTSGSMYVSGPPGTGKTACLTKILKLSNISSKYQKVYINCTSVTSIGHIYKDIAEELKLSDPGSKETIERFLVTNHKMILLVLDEVDQLIGKKQSILYSIFEWPSIKNSRLVLIGIANALDLTDRMLPRLNAKCGLKPKLMHFAPYTKQQIVTIFTERLKEADVLELFPPVTIQLLAGKVAAISGDVRRALDIGRRVVEIAEQQKLSSKNMKTGDIDLTELGISPLESTVPPINEKVEMTQVVNVLNNVYGASQNLNEDIEDAFPLQQKIVICTLLLLLKYDKNKDVTVGRLHDVYKKICGKRSIAPLDQSEFYGLCDLVQTRGILTLQKKKEPRQCKVCLQWDEEEVNQSLKDKQLISSILSDVACLTK